MDLPCAGAHCGVVGVCSRYSWVHPRFGPSPPDPPPPDRPKFRVFFFFPSPATVFILFSFSWGCFVENSKRALLSFPALQNTTKTPRKDLRERKNGKKLREKEKMRNFGPPTLRVPTLRGPRIFQVWGTPPFGPPTKNFLIITISRIIIFVIIIMITTINIT